MGFRKTGPMKFPSRIGGGTFKLFLFEFKSGNFFVLEKGDVTGKENVLLRLDSNCVWADIFGSARCDCAEQLHEAMRRIVQEGSGLLIHAYDQDGRGISLRDHVRVYMFQDQGLDTVEADLKAGFKKPDRRHYRECIEILKHFRIRSVRLLSNNPHRVQELESAGIRVRRIPIEAVKLDKFNTAQIFTKKAKMGHLFSFNTTDPGLKKLFKKSLKACSGEYDGYLWRC